MPTYKFLPVPTRIVRKDDLCKLREVGDEACLYLYPSDPFLFIEIGDRDFNSHENLIQKGFSMDFSALIDYAKEHECDLIQVSPSAESIPELEIPEKKPEIEITGLTKSQLGDLAEACNLSLNRVAKYWYPNDVRISLFGDSDGEDRSKPLTLTDEQCFQILEIAFSRCELGPDDEAIRYAWLTFRQENAFAARRRKNK